MKNKTLQISEVFFSIQGEGRSIGAPAIFIRLSGCNLLCGATHIQPAKRERKENATWICDTIDVWRKGVRMTVEELTKKVLELGYTREVHLIFTGGEPLLQAPQLVGFISHFMKEVNTLPYTEVETNGTISPSKEVRQLAGLISQWNVSPKLTNSGEDKASRINEEALSFYSSLRESYFKFVVNNEKDLKEIEDLRLKFDIDKRQTLLMPGVDSRKDLAIYKTVVEWAKENKFYFSPRLHVEIWDQLTGV